MKRDRKKERGQGVSTEADDETEAAPGNQETVLAALASLHEAFESKSMDFEEFEAAKAELIGRLRVE